MSALKLKILTPDGQKLRYSCDSAVLWMAPDEKGKGEGSIGIRSGHAESIIALGNGPLEGRLQGKVLISGKTEGGFAAVLNDKVTVVTPKFTIEYTDKDADGKGYGN